MYSRFVLLAVDPDGARLRGQHGRNRQAVGPQVPAGPVWQNREPDPGDQYPGVVAQGRRRRSGAEALLDLEPGGRRSVGRAGRSQQQCHHGRAAGIMALRPRSDAET